MKARLLVVTEEETFEYRQNTNMEVYDNLGGFVNFSTPASFTIDESYFNQWRTDHLAQPTMTSLYATHTMHADAHREIVSEEQYRRNAEEQRRLADERSRTRARQNRWEE